jgi:hypothetical protein
MIKVITPSDNRHEKLLQRDITLVPDLIISLNS